MADWFDKPRFDLNGASTADLIKLARDSVIEAQGFAESRFPARVPGEPTAEAARAVRNAWRDPAAAGVLKSSGVSEQGTLAALERGRFDKILRDLNTAIQTGKVASLLEGEGLTRAVIEAQSRYEGATRDVKAAPGGAGRLQQGPAVERTDAARAGAVGTIEAVKKTLDADARGRDVRPSRPVSDYWKAAARSAGSPAPASTQTADRGSERGRGQSQTR
jgi:hypothetical protein